MVIIQAKDPHFNGLRLGIMFRNGRGETSDEHLIEWFKAHGYKLIPPPITNEQAVIFDNMSDEGLKQFLIDNGYKKRLGKSQTRAKMLKLAKELVADG